LAGWHRITGGPLRVRPLCARASFRTAATNGGVTLRVQSTAMSHRRFRTAGRYARCPDRDESRALDKLLQPVGILFRATGSFTDWRI